MLEAGEKKRRKKKTLCPKVHKISEVDLVIVDKPPMALTNPKSKKPMKNPERKRTFQNTILPLGLFSVWIIYSMCPVSISKSGWSIVFSKTKKLW